jgi:hypothetical protein
MIGIAIALVVFVGPLLLGLTSFVPSRDPSVATVRGVPPQDWRLTLSSALLYVLAFNLTFFIQELFLVLPKAFTPGLRPTLFHNNHSWEGHHPLASLFQGTGALAIFTSAVVCSLLLRQSRARSRSVRLFLIWMAYNGFFQSLPQVVVGAINPGNDVGMAMDYLQLSPTTKLIAALIALIAIPPLALWLTRQVLALAATPADLGTARARARFVFQVAAIPALLALPLIIAFRVPRELVEVVLAPVVVGAIGIAWMQAGAWRIDDVKIADGSGAGSLAYPVGAVLILLLVFQLLLRPGIAFY